MFLTLLAAGAAAVIFLNMAITMAPKKRKRRDNNLNDSLLDYVGYVFTGKLN